MTRTHRTLRRRDEAGYVVVLFALLASAVFLGMAAFGVDTARWYVEVERVQKAADAAALAGVTYMPNDLAKARTTALEVSKKNGYDDASALVAVTVDVGSKPSELKVTVTSKVSNAFGGALGFRSAWITRSSVSDYTAPAPMGSPCNTFGNEPPGSAAGAQPAGTALPAAADQFDNCLQDVSAAQGGINPGMSNPRFWAGVEGPETDKVQGDRYQAKKCNESNNTGAVTYGCTTGSSGTSTEYKQQGYYFAIHVEPEAINTQIDVQVYDPAFVPAGLTCDSMPDTGLSNSMNNWVSDGLTRYGRSTVAGAPKFCSGDSFVGGSTTARGTMTTFVMRNRTETANPDKATAIAACPAKQFRGFTGAPSANALNKSSGSYNDQLARVFHQWVSICTFIPPAAGDYFLQVRTNVSLAGTPSANTNSNNPVIYTGNPAATAESGNYVSGAGANSFSVRAVPLPATSTAKRDAIAVSAWERMPILQLASSPATFNLVRALPNSKGQYLTFDYFDAADNANGTVKVLPPLDASGDVMSINGIPGCKAGKNDASPATYTSLTGCSIAATGTVTDGQLIHVVIPIPTNYNCDDSTLGGCWFRVELAYGASVRDFTTWSANIGGDPVRLIE